MPNPYDQFDEPAATSNPYDQFDDAPTKQKKPTPKEYTWGEAFRAAPGNAKQGIADMGAAAADLLYDTVTDYPGTLKRVGKAAGSVVPAMVTTGMAMSPWAKALPKSAQTSLKNLSPPIADLVGQYYAGYLDGPTLRRRIAEHPIATAADIATLGTLPVVAQAGRALASRLPAKVAGAANAARYAAVPTHAINDATGYVAKKVVPKVASRVMDAVKPTNAMMTRNLEGRGAAVLNALVKPKTIVPGSAPTTAQAASAADAPRFVAVAKAAEKRNPGQHLDNLNDQHRARVDYLRTVADDEIEFRNPDDPVTVLHHRPTLDEHIKDLISKRTDDKIEDYGISDPIMGQTNANTFDILGRPLNSTVLDDAKRLAANDKRPFGKGDYVPEEVIPEQVIPDPYGQDIPPTVIPEQVIPAKYPELSGLDIDTIKAAFDDLVFKGRTSTTGGGLGPKEIQSIRRNREAFLSWANSVNPDYTAARVNFADNSRNIDRAKLVKYLEDRLQRPTMGEDTIAPRADVFSNAVREAAGANPSVNAATGEKRFSNLSDRFDPGDMGVVQNIQDDMARAQLADAQGVLGNHYSSEIDAILTEGLGFSPNNAMARMVMGPVNRHLGNKAVQGLSSTQGAAKMVENAMAVERMKELSGMGYAGVRNFLTYGNPARWANRYPALYNAMGAQQGQQPQ